MIAKRIRHKGICDHAQTPHARRKCRAAKLAEAIAAEAAAKPTYRAGDSVDVDGTQIILCTWKGSYGLRWSWYAPSSGAEGVGYHPTPEAAIARARAALAPARRCGCGAVAEMTSSTGPACARCYDRRAA